MEMNGEKKQLTQDEVNKICGEYFAKTVAIGNEIAGEVESTEVAAKVLLRAAIRYLTFHMLEGGYVDRLSEDLIVDKALAGALEGLNSVAENAVPPAPPPMTNAKKIITSH